MNTSEQNNAIRTTRETRVAFHSTFRHALANFPKHVLSGEFPQPF